MEPATPQRIFTTASAGTEGVAPGRDSNGWRFTHSRRQPEPFTKKGTLPESGKPSGLIWTAHNTASRQSYDASLLRIPYAGFSLTYSTLEMGVDGPEKAPPCCNYSRQGITGTTRELGGTGLWDSCPYGERQTGHGIRAKTWQFRTRLHRRLHKQSHIQTIFMYLQFLARLTVSHRVASGASLSSCRIARGQLRVRRSLFRLQDIQDQYAPSCALSRRAAPVCSTQPNLKRQPLGGGEGSCSLRQGKAGREGEGAGSCSGS